LNDALIVLLTIFFMDASQGVDWSSIVYCPIHTIAMLHAIYSL